MRSKEDAHDYRYFPEPDLQPLVVTAEFIETVKSQMPELPDTMRDRFSAVYGLGFSDASQLVADIDLAEYFEKTARITANPKPLGEHLQTVSFPHRITEFLTAFSAWV